MRRVPCDERSNWRETAEQVGFDFHTIGGERYWDERAYYAFTLEQIERDIEAPTSEIDGMCRQLVERAIDDEQIMKRLQIPPRFWNWIAASYRRGEPSQASTAVSISATTDKGRRSFSNTMPIPLPLYSRPPYSSGSGWRTPRPAASSPRMPISSIHCTSD